MLYTECKNLLGIYMPARKCFIPSNFNSLTYSLPTLTAGLDDLGGLFYPKWFSDSTAIILLIMILDSSEFWYPQSVKKKKKSAKLLGPLAKLTKEQINIQFV